MASLYVHFPYCKKKCHYCNFVSSALRKRTADYVAALTREIKDRRGFFPEGSILNTVYFGGGTPSLMKSEEITGIMQQIRKYFVLHKDAEITVEVNPDDAGAKYYESLLEIGVNRLSIGVQSFIDAELQYLGRIHDAAAAEQAIVVAQKTGFTNINIDLIFGLPVNHEFSSEENINKALYYSPQHISAYSLTLEEKTAMDVLVRKGSISPPDEDKAAKEFLLFMDRLGSAGYEHYEISNYALPGYRSKHNSAYWNNVPYLGIGAGAHSYDMKSRSWNTDVINEYIDQTHRLHEFRQEEILTVSERYNDYLLTSLRTAEGTDSEYVRKHFGEEYAESLQNETVTFLNRRYLEKKGTSYILTRTGKLWADLIAAALIYDSSMQG